MGYIHQPAHIMWSTKVIVACLLFIATQCRSEKWNPPTDEDVEHDSKYVYVHDFDVHYGGSSPPYRYLNQDINKGFGGEYVWIKPIWTSSRGRAASGFVFVKTSSSQPY